MQKQSNDIELLSCPVPLDPRLGISHADSSTHSPDTVITYLHYHDCLEIGFCYEGGGIFIIGNKIIPFSAGCASIIPKQLVHIARSSVELGSKWRFINLDPVLLLGKTLPNAAWLLHAEEINTVHIVKPDDPSGIPAIVRELIDESMHDDFAAEQAVKGLTLCMLARMARLSPEHDRSGPLVRGHIKHISAALDFIVKNYPQPIYIPELAAACGISVATFRRIFMKAMGVAPNDYIHNLRIQLAAVQLLFSPLPVLDIALSVGYDSLSGFNRHFSHIMGTSPREYRKRNMLPLRTKEIPNH